MRAVYAEAAGRFDVTDLPDPEPRAGEVVVKVSHCTICGSDVKLLNGVMGDIRFPLVPGHEWSGVVVEAPPELSHLVDRPVVADILQACGGCRYCNVGQPNLCPDLVEPGLTINGAFAEYVAVEADRVHTLPDGVSLRDACLIEPLAVVLYALRRLPVRLGQRVAILGGGGIGQLLAQAVRRAGAAEVALIDPHPERRAIAERLGADTVLDPGEVGRLTEDPESQPDLVFDVAGRAEAFRTALDLVAPGGRIAAVGYSGGDTVVIEPSVFMRKLIDVRGVLSPTGTWEEAVEHAERGTIDLASLVTHELPLADFEQGFRLAEDRSDGAIRVAIRS